MRKTLSLLLLLPGLMLVSTAQALDAQDVLEKTQKKQLERWKGVNTYRMEQRIFDRPMNTYFERTEVTDRNGKQHTLFLPASNLELCANENGQPAVNVPGVGGSASNDAAENANYMADFIATARLLGTETVEGRKTYHVMAPMQEEQTADGRTYRMEEMHLYIDSKDYVPLLMRINGTMSHAGEAQAMTIERTQTDYRTVPGSNMFESYKQITNITGMLDDEQRAQMAEAQEQMAEMEKQLASMPESQRAMMEQMMGPQMEQIRSMVSGGGFRSETLVTAIEVNVAIPDSVRQSGCGPMGASSFTPSASAPVMAQAAAPAAAAPGAASGGNVTAIVQQHLTTLGYNTDGTSGEMNTATAIAISQFQAENQMAVTGEASPQLAGVLAARVSGGGSAATASAYPNETPEQTAQRECLEKKIAKEQEKRENKKGFGKLVSAVTNTVSRYGDNEIIADISETSRDIFDANATANDWAEAAREMGLSKKQVKKCMEQ